MNSQQWFAIPLAMHYMSNFFCQATPLTAYSYVEVLVADISSLQLKYLQSLNIFWCIIRSAIVTQNNRLLNIQYLPT